MYTKEEGIILYYLPIERNWVFPMQPLLYIVYSITPRKLRFKLEGIHVLQLQKQVFRLIFSNTYFVYSLHYVYALQYVYTAACRQKHSNSQNFTKCFFLYKSIPYLTSKHFYL